MLARFHASMGCSCLGERERAVHRRAQRTVGELGFRAVFIRPSSYIDERPFSAPVYDRFWTAMQELGVPVALHPGGGTPGDMAPG